jgi:hypothetical protein
MSLLRSRDQTLGPALEKGRFFTEHRSLKDVVASKQMPSNLVGESAQKTGVLISLTFQTLFSRNSQRANEKCSKTFKVTEVLSKKESGKYRKGFIKMHKTAIPWIKSHKHNAK